ncbi:cytochrome-c oxidase, cbb3-type subunit III [Paracoccus sp. SCSIO 75233]|uniref:cytochrome-c oxidase, cbb3-type subunit III n=1 Tax=Paracoccus sp. SCSIO 75233 TaxID=3017782 RepID=UPI0022F00A20|nr:cytochrome-c oxidase, cbb3-type subunit III [Paracoccus sp. SCSIO 75233]WBU52128.1 cytochrome-c oxidase, cbb3-type subunit III [Paracoccus sp. SCSIO 75233]
MADNDKTNEHGSPQNPDNRIELERAAADKDHASEIAQQQTGTEAGAKKQPAQRRAGPRTGKQKAGGMVTEVASTGHTWDGIKEYDNPLPRWWLWTFYATIVWAILYTVAYPAWPLVNGATQGLLGTNYRKEVAAEIQRYDEANADVQQALVEADLNAIGDNPELANYSMNAGRAVFATWCAQCHGSGAAGARGYPNLLDNDWLWGGSLEEIHTTVSHGIRNEDDADARYSEMPRFGADEILDDESIDQVVQTVLAMSGQEHDADQAEAGQQIYADNCALCHMDDGTGDRMQGAPDLTDAIWLYGGDEATIRESVSNARFGVMPNWSPRLSEDDIRAVSYYVHSLGGGE